MLVVVFRGPCGAYGDDVADDFQGKGLDRHDDRGEEVDEGWE